MAMGSSYGHCDTFFVEAEDSGVYAQRAAARDHARALAREQQLYIAEELSRVTSDEYQDDILDHMEHMESATLPDVNSIDIQSEIQWFMRPYLLDFLVEAHTAFQLHPDTLYLTVNLLDRYCSRRVVYKRHYQLVGCAALLIAAKYGDRKERVPTVRELKSMCCNLYEEEMFTQMEWHVLNTLDWIIGHPTVDSFLQIALSEVPYDQELEHLAWYISEIALFHRDFVSTRASTLARSALSVARFILSRSDEHATNWAKRCDKEVMAELAQKVRQPSSVLYKKFSSSHYSSVARTVDLFLQRQDEIHRQQTKPLTPAVSTGAFSEHIISQEQASMPLTPQKGLNPPGVAYGYITPPITPEGAAMEKSSAFSKPSVYPGEPGSMAMDQVTPPSHTRPEPYSAPQYSYGYPASRLPHQNYYG